MQSRDLHCEKMVSNFPVLSRDFTNQTLPDFIIFGPGDLHTCTTSLEDFLLSATVLWFWKLGFRTPLMVQNIYSICFWKTSFRFQSLQSFEKLPVWATKYFLKKLNLAIKNVAFYADFGSANNCMWNKLSVLCAV